MNEGEAVWLPRDVPHTFLIESETARLLAVTTPAGFEGFHVEAGDPAVEARIPDAVPLAVDRMLAAIDTYDAEIVGPPMNS